MWDSVNWDELLLVCNLPNPYPPSLLTLYFRASTLSWMEELIKVADEIIRTQRGDFILIFIAGLPSRISFVSDVVGAVGMTATREVLRKLLGQRCRYGSL